jgi:hypothetical protein
LNQEDVNYLNRAIKSSEIEELWKRRGPNEFIAEFYQTFKEELTSIFLKLFHEIEREGMLSNSF